MAYSSEIAAQRLHALINSRPSSPSIDEMEAIIAEAQNETAEAEQWPADDVGLQIRDAIGKIVALEAVTPDGNHSRDDATAAEFLKLDHQLEAAEAKLPKRPSTLAHLIALAELAWFWADKTDGILTPLTEVNTAGELIGGADETSSAILIAAVLEFAGLAKTYKLGS